MRALALCGVVAFALGTLYGSWALIIGGLLMAWAFDDR